MRQRPVLLLSRHLGEERVAERRLCGERIGHRERRAARAAPVGATDHARRQRDEDRRSDLVTQERKERDLAERSADAAVQRSEGADEGEVDHIPLSKPDGARAIRALVCSTQDPVADVRIEAVGVAGIQQVRPAGVAEQEGRHAIGPARSGPGSLSQEAAQSEKRLHVVGREPAGRHGAAHSDADVKLFGA